MFSSCEIASSFGTDKVEKCKVGVCKHVSVQTAMEDKNFSIMVVLPTTLNQRLLPSASDMSTQKEDQ